MARAKVTLDNTGIAAELKSTAIQREIAAKTDQVARAVEEQGITVGALSGGGEMALPVETSQTTTDRAHGSVSLAHPAGLAVQAKYGALTKAAARAGLQVKDKGQ